MGDALLEMERPPVEAAVVVDRATLPDDRLVKAWVVWDRSAHVPRYVSDGHHGEAAAIAMETACAEVCADAGLSSVTAFRVALSTARCRLTAGGNELDCRSLTTTEMLRCISEAVDICRDGGVDGG